MSKLPGSPHHRALHFWPSHVACQTKRRSCETGKASTLISACCYCGPPIRIRVCFTRRSFSVGLVFIFPRTWGCLSIPISHPRRTSFLGSWGNTDEFGGCKSGPRGGGKFTFNSNNADNMAPAKPSGIELSPWHDTVSAGHRALQAILPGKTWGRMASI
jgi:hypothetical protein